MSKINMQTILFGLFFAYSLTFLVACRADQQEVAPGVHSESEAALVESSKNAQGHDHDHDHDHDHEQHELPEPSEGPLDVKLGEAIDSSIPIVSVYELMTSGEKYAGQTIRVEGEVTDMCFHRRGWFGIADEEGKRVVRVAVADRFLAPEDALGSKAVAQGVVEIRTISAADLEHYRSAHRFLPPEALESEEDVLLPTIVGSGATFNR